MRVLPTKLSVIPAVALCSWMLASPGQAQPPSPTPGTLKWRVPLNGALSAGPTLGTNGLVYAVGRTDETLLFAWESSADLLNWIPLETLMNTTGRIEFLDGTAAGTGQKFYRAVRVE